MDVDTVHPALSTGRADEDLIDFDTDMADQPEGDWTRVEGTPRATQDDGSLEDIELEGHFPGYPNEAPEAGEHAENDDLDLEAGSSLMVDKDPATTKIEHGEYEEHEVHEVQPAQSEDGNGYPSPSSHEQRHDDYVDLGEGFDDQGHLADDAPVDDEPAHEIDYELEDHESELPQDQVDEYSHGAVGVDAAGFETSAEDQARTGADDLQTETRDVHHGDSENAEQSDHDEINWNNPEDDDGHDGSNIGDQENQQEDDPATVEDLEEAAEGQHNAVAQQNDEEAGQASVEGTGESDQPIAGQHEDDEAGNYGEGTEGDYEDEHEITGSQAADTAASLEEATSSADSDFPAITVQYKGDEFPCFSTASEGFFTDISILDDTMEALLSKFREELVNEIPNEDELVFQVDELGLEFAESSLRDSLSSVTLRQILEIFDLLVKNQDPDGSRTLYTYLFTKPSTSKRLESLIDSATAGKGLDEVIHLFESPMPNNAAVLDANLITHGYDEQLDEYESPDDVLGLQEDQIQAGDEQGEEAVDDAGFSGPGDDNQADLEGYEHDVDVEEDEGNEVEESVVEEAAEIGGDTLDGVTELEKADENAPIDSESNPFLNLELDTEPNDEVGLDSDYGDESSHYGALRTDGINVANTSTTTTVRADDDAASINLDVGDVPAEDHTATGATVEELEDELQEIDWIEDTDADQEVPYTPSGIGKRGRIDDNDSDAEDEKDVKRRRS